MREGQNEVIKELQMLTGSSVKDVTVLYYLLIKDGSYFEDIEANVLKPSDAIVKPFGEWFDDLEVVE